jgi:tetratricopeptide (TPR) repeat protein
MKTLLGLCCFCLSCAAVGRVALAEGSTSTSASTSTSGKSTAISLIADASRAFDSADFSKSVELYNQALNSGTVNGALLFNLGNAYFRTAHVGEAIASYKGALRFLPRDADILANIEAARKLRKDIIEEKNRSADIVFFWFAWATGREYSAIGGIVAGVASAFLFFCRFKPQLPKWPLWVLAPVVLFLFLTTIGKYFQWTEPSEAVVKAAEVSVKSANGEGNVTLFLLHAGAEVVVGEHRDDWVQIQIADDRKGWMREEFLANVASVAK